MGDEGEEVCKWMCSVANLNRSNNNVQTKYKHTNAHTHTQREGPLDEGYTRPDQSASPIPHTCIPSLRPIPLHPRKRVLYMLRPKRRPGLRWG